MLKWWFNEEMLPLRNGSLLANALLVAIGASAGAGVTMLITPDRPVVILEKDDPSSRLPTFDLPSGNSAPGRPRRAAQFDIVTDLQQLTDPRERSIALREAGAAAARLSPGDAMRQAELLTSEQDKLDFYRGIYGVWGGTDPRAALDHARSNFMAGLLRAETIGIAVNKWGSKDPRGAWLWVEQHLSGPLKDQALTDLVIGWSRQTPTVAAKWLESTGYYSQPLFNAVATTWAEQNPQAAYQWAANLPKLDARNTAVIGIIGEHARQNPAEAAKLYTPELTGANGLNIAATIADIWGTTDPSAAAAWIRGLADGPAKREAAATLATVWAATDIDSAIAWTNSMTDSQMRRQVIAQIGTTWGAIEPDKALNWLRTMPAADASGGIIGAYNSWAATDAAGLADWINSNPSSSAMDQPRLSLADVTASQDIPAAMDLALSLSTAAGRDQAVVRYFREWRKVDNDSAQDWLAQNLNSLPASTQQRIALEQVRPVVFR